MIGQTHHGNGRIADDWADSTSDLGVDELLTRASGCRDHAANSETVPRRTSFLKPSRSADRYRHVEVEDG